MGEGWRTVPRALPALGRFIIVAAAQLISVLPPIKNSTPCIVTDVLAALLRHCNASVVPFGEQQV
jgi:hypothetical protein